MDGRRARASTLVAYLALALLAGCGSAGTSSAAPSAQEGSSSEEVTTDPGRPCPDELPQPADDSHGFGTSDPAGSSPALAAPERAWVCQYVAERAGPGPDGDGSTFAWVRDGGVRRVPDSRLPGLARQLGELEPADRLRGCTDDLGSRWMLVYAAGSELTGVVIDAFGCRDIRLTDDPFRTVPGEATRHGTVPGVLTGPEQLVDRLVALHGRS